MSRVHKFLKDLVVLNVAIYVFFVWNLGRFQVASNFIKVEKVSVMIVWGGLLLVGVLLSFFPKWKLFGRVFCNLFVSPFSYLLIKLMLGVKESGQLFYGTLKFYYLYTEEEIKRFILNYIKGKPYLSAYVEEKGLVEKIAKEADHSMEAAQQILENLEKDLETHLSVWLKCMIWILDHPFEVLGYSLLIGGVGGALYQGIHTFLLPLPAEITWLQKCVTFLLQALKPVWEHKKELEPFLELLEDSEFLKMLRELYEEYKKKKEE
jgi:hypothetical protein